MVSTHRIAAAAMRVSRSRADPGHICLSCQLRALSTSRKPALSSRPYTLSQSRCYASNDGFEGSFADRLRKRIWGTDNPPGQRNPYVRESPEEHEERLAEQADREAREIEEADFQRMRQAREDDVTDDVAEDEEGSEFTERGAPVSKEYVPATTWKGLRHVPGWKVTKKEPTSQYNGFIAQKRLVNAKDIERAVQRAIIEVWVMNEARESPMLPTTIGNPTSDFEERILTGATFTESSLSLNFTDGALREDVMISLGLSAAHEVEGEEERHKVFDRMSEDELVGSKSRGKAYNQTLLDATQQQPAVETISADDVATSETIGEEAVIVGKTDDSLEKNSEKVLPDADRSFRSVSFVEPEIKFAVLKRVMQLTGSRIPDPAIPHLNGASDLLAHLIKPPPAKKLVEKITSNWQLARLQNLQVYANRYTIKDKEEEIGRWKLIEEELAKRGLPTDMREVKQKKRVIFDAERSIENIPNDPAIEANR